MPYGHFFRRRQSQCRLQREGKDCCSILVFILVIVHAKLVVTGFTGLAG
jgi:hypothetical protein